jgi:RHH-type proline utilization regulon transcriptional repressor/proline dehydrogenase/delta 1-pyrroline-5-carboxylate dehydrogenase
VSRGQPHQDRIVKGANMEMELLESSLCGWPLAPYDNKLDVDANWKRMVAYGLEPDHIRAVRLGVASHNLFDVAFAYQLARRNQVTEFFIFEMIEGMANHVRRAVRETGQDLLAYAPVAEDRHFIHAVAYSSATGEDLARATAPRQRLKTDTPPGRCCRALPRLVPLHPRSEPHRRRTG